MAPTPTVQRFAVDTSVLVAALVPDEAEHLPCRALLQRQRCVAWSHAGLEVFSTLTGGRLRLRLQPAMAATGIQNILNPLLEWLELSNPELQAAMAEAGAVGARGGAIFDYLHLVAGRKAGASRFYTLNHRHFAALARSGDPQVLHPSPVS